MAKGGAEAPDHSDSAGDQAWRRVARGALVLALGVVAVRFVFVAPASLSYDESTYVDLAQHPWHSDYYPDAVFLRHPPLYFLLLAAWAPLAGGAEALLRLPSLVASLAGVALTWDALRRRGGDRAAAVGSLLMGTSFLTLVYGLQATMYPLAFALAALGLWAHARGREGLERTALVLLALTHLFGFLFLVGRLWRHRTAWRREAATAAPALAWLGAAGIAAVILPNPPGPALGPGWQALRVFALLYEGFAEEGALAAHLAAFLVALLLLNPAVIRAAWRDRARWSPWALGGLLVVAVLLPGPGFLRYALLPAPVVLAAGLPRLLRGPAAPRGLATALAMALAAGGAGALFVASEVDPRAGNDVPGAVDWASVADELTRLRPAAAVTPATTATAHYLVTRHAWTVADASHGPGRLGMAGPGGAAMTLREAVAPDRLVEDAGPGVALVVPESWSEALRRLREAGQAECAAPEGARVLAAPDEC